MDTLCAVNTCALATSERGPGRIVCRCLQVSAEVVMNAITTLELRTVKEIRQHTGAGDGCTCCHKALKKYLEKSQSVNSSPASSVT